ncbi:MAG: hypothetical protein PGN11_05120 [Quadrisphaera sp.]
MDAQGDAGFDVLSELRDGRSVGSKAWASLTVGGKQGLYEVNLTNAPPRGRRPARRCHRHRGAAGPLSWPVELTR